MSATKKYLEIAEQKEALRKVLQILLDTEQIEHDVSKGIARKIIADGNVDGLSPKQLDVFDKYIEPFIKILCENEGCNNEIELLSLPEAYENHDEFGGLFCIDCTINMGRLKNL